MTQIKLCETIGLEVEVEDISSRRFPSHHIFRPTNDASVQSTIPLYQGFPIVENEFQEIGISNIRRNNVGFEVVSQIIDTNKNYLPDIKWLTSELRKMGESEKSYRAGIHCHVSLSINLRIAKEVLKLARHLEQVFFLIGGMGYDFRGKKNDSTYMRPVTKWGPLVVPVPKGYAQCMNIKDLLKTETLEEFEHRYGNLDRFRGNRYIPIRYHWINLRSLFETGTLEFRVFNKTLNPYYIWSIVELSKKFSAFALKASLVPSISQRFSEENSVFSAKNKSYIIDTYLNWAEIAEISDGVTEILIEIMEQVPLESIQLPKQYTFCHLQFHRRGNRVETHFIDSNYRPTLISKKEVKEPDFVDSHVLAERTGITPDSIPEPRNRLRDVFARPRQPSRWSSPPVYRRATESIENTVESTRSEYSGNTLSTLPEGFDFRGAQYATPRGRFRLAELNYEEVNALVSNMDSNIATRFLIEYETALAESVERPSNPTVQAIPLGDSARLSEPPEGEPPEWPTNTTSTFSSFSSTLESIGESYNRVVREMEELLDEPDLAEDEPPEYDFSDENSF